MYKALTNFSGIISMNKGEVRDISNKELAEKLIKANYIEKVLTDKTKEKVTKMVKPKK